MKPGTITELLNQLSPMVVLTGSFMEGTATENSDIDLYIKPLPPRHALRKHGAEDYTPIIIDLLQKWGFSISSCYPQTFATDAFGWMLDFSAYYEIEKPHPVQLFGANLMGAKSTYSG